MLVLLVRNTEADPRCRRATAGSRPTSSRWSWPSRTRSAWKPAGPTTTSGPAPICCPPLQPEQPPGNRCYAVATSTTRKPGDNVFLQFYPLLADAAGVTVD